MMKKFTLILTLAFFFLMGSNIQAQLADNTIAPDFTVTDIDGNEHTLYDYLDQGMTVILDVSATWCGPCWTYMEAGVLEEIYEEYGPEGTNEIMVLFVEGDANTNDDDLNGLTAATQGDWVSAINYPIIDGADGANIGDLYNINYFPTMYTIYPNRVIVESGQRNTEDHLAIIGPDFYIEPIGENNAGVLNYKGAEFACGDVNPVFSIQNVGTENLTSLTVELVENGEVTQTMEWTGDVAQYDLADVMFDPIQVVGTSNVEINISSPNGSADEGSDPNTLGVELISPSQNPFNDITLLLAPDNWPDEVTIEIQNGDGDVIASYDQASAGFATGQIFELVFSDLDLTNGCHEIHMYDTYGDGVAGSAGGGVLIVANETVLYSDASFATGDVDPGAANEVVIPFLVKLDSDQPVDFGMQSSLVGAVGCAVGELGASVYNYGTDELTEIDFVLSVDGDEVETINWTGSLEQGETGEIMFDNVDVFGFADESNVQIVASSPAGTDADESDNASSNVLVLPKSSDGGVTFALHTDKWPEEIAFELVNSNGDVVFSNADFGTLECETFYEQVLELPQDCYDFTITDSFGDGVFNGGVQEGSHACTNGDPTFTEGAISILAVDGSVIFDNNAYGTGTSFGFRVVGDALPFSASIEGAVDELNYTAAAETTGEDVEFAWEVMNAAGDVLATGDGADFSYDFDANGEYTVVLMATNGEGVTTTSSETFTIAAIAPVVDFVGVVEDAIYTGGIASDDENAEYSWVIMDADGNEIAAGDGADFSYEFEENGEYMVEVIATNEYGLSDIISEEFSITSIVVDVAPTAAIDGGVTDGAYTATAETDDADATFAWTATDIDGNEVATGDDIAFATDFTSNGEYTVTLVVTGANGLSATTTEVVTVDTFAPVGFLENSNTAPGTNLGDPTTYTTTAGSDDPDAQYTWTITNTDGDIVASGNTKDVSAEIELNGVYTLEMTVFGNNGLETVVTESITVTDSIQSGIEDLNVVNNVKIFPVPATNQLTVQMDLKEAQNMTISVSNLLGETVEVLNQNRFNEGENTIQINTAAYSNGLYFINIETDAQIASQRFVVTK